MRTRLVALIASLLAFVGVAPAAHALDGFTRAPSGVLYEPCFDHPVEYSATFPPGTTYWNMEISVIGPDGLEEGSDYLSAYLGNSTSGTALVQLCGNTLPGRYIIKASGEHETDGTTYLYSLPESSFTMRPAESRTWAKALSRFRVKVKVKDERPAGYFATEFPVVRLEKKQDGRWRRVPGSKQQLGENGRATFCLPDLAGMRVRAVTLPDDYAGSKSRPVRVHR